MKREIIELAKNLKTNPEVLFNLDNRLTELTNKKNVLEKIYLENQEKIKNIFLNLGLNFKKAYTEEIYDFLFQKVNFEENLIFNYFGKPDYYQKNEGEKILNLIKEYQKIKTGFFLKEEKAKELLLKEPPQEILNYLNYSSVSKMLENEDLYEIYSALRFVQGSDWLNKVFLKQYKNLTVDDFEFREIKIKILSEKWLKAAQKFVYKKWHNISHLKELGILFIIPLKLNLPGEFLRMLNLVFHYLNEIPFYSNMFLKIKNESETFSKNLISLLRGDILEKKIISDKKSLWLVIQRYLAKENENDWRLFVPHINPEALHWQKATQDLYNFFKKVDNLEKEFRFWLDLDWVIGIFKDKNFKDNLISFNLIDTTMSLVKKEEEVYIKYLYHAQEALWNKIFESYFSRKDLEEFIYNYLISGYFEL